MEADKLLRILFANHRRLVVPPDAKEEPLSRLHADLVEYDGFVAGIIESMLRGKRKAAQNLYYDEELQHRLERALTHGEQQAVLAGSYRNYLLSIKSLVDTAAMYVSSPPAAA